MSFRALPDHELDRLGDRALIGYLRAARAAGQDGAARRALQLLVFGHWDLVEARVAMRVPSEAVQDVTADVVVRAIALGVRRRVGRRAAGVADDDPATHGGRLLRRARAHAGGRPVGVRAGPTSRASSRRRRWSSRRWASCGPTTAGSSISSSSPTGRPAEACARVGGVTEANAYQIVRRFRARLRALLEDPEDG